MDVAQRTWISSTAATESTGLAAAKAVLDWHERTDVPERMATAGGMLLQIIGTALSESPWVGVRAEGPPMMWRLVSDAPDALDALVAAAARDGLLLKRGAYQFGAIAHDEAALEQVAELMPRIMHALLPGPRRVED
jgi:glutamate-1-semialdehyde 2,1-aminomutase